MTKRAGIVRDSSNKKVKYDDDAYKILVLEKENFELLNSCDNLGRQVTLVARKNREVMKENEVLKKQVENFQGKFRYI